MSISILANAIGKAVAPSGGISGSKTIAAALTPEILTGTFKLKSGIWIQAGGANTGYLEVRIKSFTSGIRLNAGESFYVAIDDPSKIEVLVSVGGETVRWLGT